MRHSKIPLADTNSFNPFFLDYIQQKDTLKPFYSVFPIIDNFNKVLTIKSASFDTSSREVLKESLIRQHSGIDLKERAKANLELLSDPRTFTVTTGHQLNILTGPMYFIFKIVTVINTCVHLGKKFPDYNFVPVYWMASEDHDYDEIKYFRLYGEKYVWETEQAGAVGRFHTDGIGKLLEKVPGDTSLFRQAYKKNKTLAEAVRYYINELFGNQGLITVDGDDASLKKVFAPVIREDILNNTTVRLVENTNRQLEKLQFKPQIFCRDINFFYLDDHLRNRIEKKENLYYVTETELKFPEKEIKDLINSSPEKFSPNVILRPLYQEMILPNIAYVGGPAEVVYWLQLKSVFDHFHIPFPALMPRNFGMVIDHTLHRKLEKTGLTYDVLFEPSNYISNHWVLNNTSHDLTVGKERAELIKTYEALKLRAEKIDKTLAPFVGAEGKRLLNSLEKIEKKLLRAEKRRHHDRLRQIGEIKDGLFPNGSLQERTDNFLNFYQRDPQFIQKLIDTFDPFDFSFNILTYTDQ